MSHFVKRARRMMINTDPACPLCETQLTHIVRKVFSSSDVVI